MKIGSVFLLLSQRFGWTPKQIKEMGVMELRAYLDAMNPKKVKKESKAIDLLIAMMPRA